MRLLCFSLMLTLIPFASRAGEDTFVFGFEDIPLMQGLTESSDSLISFDSPSGRFIQAVLLVEDDTLSAQKITDFYTENLASLGFQVIASKSKDENCYIREDEKLCFKMNVTDTKIITLELRSN